MCAYPVDWVVAVVRFQAIKSRVSPYNIDTFLYTTHSSYCLVKFLNIRVQSRFGPTLTMSSRGSTSRREVAVHTLARHLLTVSHRSHMAVHTLVRHLLTASHRSHNKTQRWLGRALLPTPAVWTRYCPRCQRSAQPCPLRWSGGCRQRLPEGAPKVQRDAQMCVRAHRLSRGVEGVQLCGNLRLPKKAPAHATQ